MPAVAACNPDGVGPVPTTLPQNQSPTDSSYQCSVGVRLQPAVDRARQISHTLGFRPYQVFLVWQERDLGRVWREVASLELIPVRIRRLDGLDLELGPNGLHPEGTIELRDISPTQVNQDVLRGFLNGDLWGRDTIDREFFYEVRLRPRCAGEGELRRWRFALSGAPYFDGESLEYRVTLTDQEIQRDRNGVDQTTPLAVFPTNREPDFLP